MIGFFLYGPQMLIGLCGAEIVGRRSVGASEGFLGWIAYLGAANAGVPLSLLVQQYGWDAFFGALLSSCLVAVLLLLPLIRQKPSSKALINECIKDVIFVRYYKYSNALALFFLLHVDTPLFRRTSVILIHVVIR